ncbi:MAG: DNA polymerase I, partial [Butyricicoccus sp.]|nr:DNA polymerase I [Butyricicoccus sp.]
RDIPELASSNFNLRSFCELAAMNTPIKVTAADIIKIAMLRVDDRLRQEGLKARLILQVHDELILEAPEAETAQVMALLREEMERAVELRVPLVAEAKSGKSWYETK